MLEDIAFWLGITFLVLLIGRVPIVFCLGLAAVAGFVVSGTPLLVLAQRMISASNTFTLVAIPGFILAGNLMSSGGLSRRLVALAHAFVRHLTGGLGFVTVISGTFFAAISGSAPATTAAIGGVMIPEMEKRGYPRAYAAALSTATGPIGQLIPPSIPMVVWGVLASQSISDLFLAGVGPGLLLAGGLLFYCWFTARRMDVDRADRISTWRELLAALNDGKWAVLAPILILGGIYGGIFTPTEASAVGVLYGLVVGLFVYRELSLADLPRIAIDAAKTSASIIFIIATASAFGWMIARVEIPAAMASAVFGMTDNPIILLLLLNVVLLIVGALMDNIAAMIILGSLIMAIGSRIGIDPIHLGTIVVMNFAIGMMTAPLGYCLFVASAISGVSLEKITRASLGMLAVEVTVLLLVTFVPAISLWLPSQF